MSPGERVAAAARARIGTRFRLQGRGEDGLDCVGLVAAALDRPGAAIADYGLRGGDAARVAAEMARAGLQAVDPAGRKAGDILLMRPGVAQLHLGVATAAGFVHAAAGLRRVVETPGDPPWPVLAAWRFKED